MVLKCVCKYFVVLLLLGASACHDNAGKGQVLERLGFVNDYASVFTREEAAALTDILAAYEKETCHQVLVLTVSSLQGESLVDFSMRTATAWEIGQSTLQNGVLITIAIQEGGVRMEAGSGLDFLVKEGRGEQILNEEMVPLFREERMVEGIRSGVIAVMDIARRKTYPENHRPTVCL